MLYVFMIVLAILFAQIYISLNNLNIRTDTLIQEGTVTWVKNLFYFLSFLIICIPGMIRYGIGIDYLTYSNYQIPAVLLHETVKVEPLYKLVIKLGYWLSGNTNYQVIFAITNVLIVGFVYKYIKDQSENITLSIFIFMAGGFFAFSWSGMRQSIGVAISLYALKYIKQRKMSRYFFWIAIAGLFHTASWIFLIFYFLNKIHFPPIYLLPIMIIEYGLAQTIRNVLIAISDKIGIYSDYFGGVFDTGIYNRLLAVGTLAILGLVIFTSYIIKPEKLEELNSEINISYLACLTVPLISVLPTPSRILFMFIPIYITLIPNLIKRVPKPILRGILEVIVCSFYVYFMYKNIYVQDDYHILPYRDIFNLFS